jgi:hypothetical protein
MASGDTCIVSDTCVRYLCANGRSDALLEQALERARTRARLRAQGVTRECEAQEPHTHKPGSLGSVGWQVSQHCQPESAAPASLNPVRSLNADALFKAMEAVCSVEEYLSRVPAAPCCPAPQSPRVRSAADVMQTPTQSNSAPVAAVRASLVLGPPASSNQPEIHQQPVLPELCLQAQASADRYLSATRALCAKRDEQLEVMASQIEMLRRHCECEAVHSGAPATPAVPAAPEQLPSQYTAYTGGGESLNHSESEHCTMPGNTAMPPHKQPDQYHGLSKQAGATAGKK